MQQLQQYWWTQRSHETYIFLARQKTNSGFQDLLIMHYKVSSFQVCTYIMPVQKPKKKKKNSYAQPHFAHFFPGMRELSTKKTFF